jgi:hypothetical protein
MHLNFKSRLLFLFIFCFAFKLHAQDFRPGYIIKNNLDSVSGYVAYRSVTKNVNKCEFKTTKKAKSSTFSAADLKGFGFVNDKKFESITIPEYGGITGPVFGQVVVRGSLNLYRVGQFYVTGKNDLIVLPLPKDKNVNNAEGQFYKNDKRYVGLLNYLINDCGLSADETSYTEQELGNLVMTYNRCKGLKPSLNFSRPLTRVNMQLFAGFFSSTTTMEVRKDVKFSPSQTIIGGISADLSSPRIFDRFFFSVEAWYVKSFYQAYSEAPFNGNMRYQDILIDVSYLKIPIGFRYNFFHENSTPYVKGGLALAIVNDITVTTSEDNVTPVGDVYSYEYYDQFEIRSPRSLWLSVGYNKTIARKLRGFVELRYESGTGFIGTGIQSVSKLNSFSILAGIRF